MSDRQQPVGERSAHHRAEVKAPAHVERIHVNGKGDDEEGPASILNGTSGDDRAVREVGSDMVLSPDAILPFDARDIVKRMVETFPTQHKSEEAEEAGKSNEDDVMRVYGG